MKNLIAIALLLVLTACDSDAPAYGLAGVGADFATAEQACVDAGGKILVADTLEKLDAAAEACKADVDNYWRGCWVATNTGSGIGAVFIPQILNPGSSTWNFSALRDEEAASALLLDAVCTFTDGDQ